jgi:DNA polymerase III subunit alpha
LHQHSDFSLLDGGVGVGALVDWVRRVTPSNPVVALTDHGNMHGAVEFFKVASAAGVKPILGFEAYVADGSRFDRSGSGYFHLTLLAKDLVGYRNLVRLSSLGFLEGFYRKPRVDLALLREFREGVIALSGCLAGEVPRTLLERGFEVGRAKFLEYLSIFGDDFFVEVQNHGLREQAVVNEMLLRLGSEFGVGVVGTNDGHYLRREDARAHEVLLAVQTKATLADEGRFRFSCDEFFVKSPEEMRLALPDSVFPGALERSMVVADACDVLLPVGSRRVFRMPSVLSGGGGLFVPGGLGGVFVPAAPGLVLPSGVVTGGGAAGGVLGASVPVGRDAVVSPARLVSPVAPAAASGSESTSSVSLAVSTGVAGDVAAGAVPRLVLRDAALSGVLLRFPSLVESGFLRALCDGVGVSDAGGLVHADPVGVLAVSDALGASSVAGLVDGARVWSRLEFELGVIERMGFVDYFLVVADFVGWARSQGIMVGPGRGSGAGSLVAFALGVTTVDPLRFGLLFERFLNPDRVSLPDFDVDFSDVRRGEVIDYVRGKYGEEYVAHIATFGTLGSRAALKDAARVLGVPFARADKLSKLVPVVRGKAVSIAEALESVPEFSSLAGSDEFREVVTVASSLEGLVRHASLHAAGVVIGGVPIQELAPVFRSGDGPVACQFGMESVEDLGFVKMDFLGLRTLSLIEECLRILRGSFGVELDLGSLSLDDAGVFELLGRGDAGGVFQFESGGMADTLRRLKPRRFEDLVAVSALFRPGPMDNIPAFIRRHHGLESVSFAEFPVAGERFLRPILAETYGIPVYQEQIMQLAVAVAGFSLAQADILRRAMGKKKHDEMLRLRESFVSGAVARDVPLGEAERIFELLVKFADYGFNKSHSVAYSLISYWTAYLKAHFREAFFAALLSVELGDSERLGAYVRDCVAAGVRVLPPSVNASGVGFVPEGGAVRFGLLGVKGVSAEVAGLVVGVRGEGGAFGGLVDFVVRTGLGKRAVEALVKAGAFDEFGDRGGLLEVLPGVLRGRSRVRGGFGGGLFGGLGVVEPVVPVVGLGLRELLGLERESLGLFLSAHPASVHVGLTVGNVVRLGDLRGLGVSGGGGRFVLGGVVSGLVKRKSARGVLYGRFELLDEWGSCEVLVFGRVLERLGGLLVDDAALVVVLDVVCEGGEVRVSLLDAVGWDSVERLGLPHAFVVSVEGGVLDEGRLGVLRGVLDGVPGLSPVVFRVVGGGGVLWFESSEFRVSAVEAGVALGGLGWCSGALGVLGWGGGV